MAPRHASMPTQLRDFFKTDIAKAFAVAILWQIVLTIIGNSLLPDPAGKNIWHHTTLWDGGWYLTIIKDHYVNIPASAAFYPLFPLVIGLLSALTFHVLGYATIAFILNTVALGFVISALFIITKHFDIGPRARYITVALFLLSPAAFFLHMFYSEALFIAVGFWAYAFALQRKWMLVGILLAILTASRLPSLLFIGLCVLEYLRSYDWNVRRAVNPMLCWFLLAPVGFVLYGSYLFAVRGNFLAMFSAYTATNDWSYQIFNPNVLSTIGQAIHKNILAITGHAPLNAELLINVSIPLFSLTLLFACSLYIIFHHKGPCIPLGIFGLVSIIFFTLNSNVISVHRYTLPCLGIYLALTLIYIHHRKLRLLVYTVALLTFCMQVYLVLRLFLTNSFVG